MRTYAAPTDVSSRVRELYASSLGMGSWRVSPAECIVAASEAAIKSVGPRIE